MLLTISYCGEIVYKRTRDELVLKGGVGGGGEGSDYSISEHMYKSLLIIIYILAENDFKLEYISYIKDFCHTFT